MYVYIYTDSNGAIKILQPFLDQIQKDDLIST